jgi:CRISPR-associated exonuclease Cas4
VTTDVWLVIAAGAAGMAAVWAVAYIVGGRAGRVDDWMPDELKDHTLAYSERTFRSGGDRQVVARVDRAYRGSSELIALVELKTRPADRVYPSDIIELSAQRVALEGETGEPVAQVGWVVVESEAGRRAHRVSLMGSEAVRGLASRRDAILAGTAPPAYPATSRLCASCAYRRRCGSGN